MLLSCSKRPARNMEGPKGGRSRFPKASETCPTGGWAGYEKNDHCDSDERTYWTLTWFTLLGGFGWTCSERCSANFDARRSCQHPARRGRWDVGDTELSRGQGVGSGGVEM